MEQTILCHANQLDCLGSRHVEQCLSGFILHQIMATCSQKPSRATSSPLQVVEDCSFLALALVIAGSTLLMNDKPLCDNAWRQVHVKLTNKAKIQLEERKERSALQAVLDIIFEELGHTQQTYFVKLAVLAYDGVASKYMLIYVWGKHVIDALWKGCQKYLPFYTKRT